MDYTQITPEEQSEMLATIGVDDVDSLFAAIPEDRRFQQLLDLPPARSELELQRDLNNLAWRNLGTSCVACFLGGGAYDHFVPAFIDQLISRGEFLTAYTPYQAEASQGALQAFFEFQTQIARLAGLDIANASLYEGATAVAEAVHLALNHAGKRRVLLAGSMHPDYRQVVRTYLSDLPVDCVELPVDPKSGTTAAAALAKELNDDVACVVVQSPNFFGQLEDWQAHFAAAHAKPKTLAIAVFNPMACALLKTPGVCGADIAVGEGQPLGIPLQFGGPYLGLFAAKKEFTRKMPGRLIGQTTDVDGRRSYCLTLQTREQHIRGERATSNVCTNQGLLALRATMYLSAMGPAGLREAAEHCYHKAHYLADRLAELPGYQRKHEGPFFNEFVIRCPRPAAEIVAAGKPLGILAGVPLDTPQCGHTGEAKDLLIAVTEKRTKDELDSLVELLKSKGSV